MAKICKFKITIFLLYDSPREKLLFMGSEFGQGLEWRYAYGLEWEILEREQHAKMKDFVKDLNHFYKREKSLYEVDNSYEGFDFMILTMKVKV